MTFDELNKAFGEYVDTFRAKDCRLPPMMSLKRVHTMMVLRNAKLIVEGEKFDADTREAALIAALLHDVGRFEQLKRYNTFRDTDSVDHAVFSHDIVVEKGWVTDEGVLNAILFHNRRELPADLDVRTLALAQTVRDADKLDIFRVLEDQIQNTDWQSDSQAFWNLPISAPPNPKVIAAIESNQPVDYQNIQSLADFVLIQVGWMVNGLAYETSRRICCERDHLAFRRHFLSKLTDDPCVDRVCDLARSALED